jgi:hypothetical protein
MAPTIMFALTATEDETYLAAITSATAPMSIKT